MKKKFLRYFTPIILVVLLSSFAWHKFYVSVTQIDYVPNKKRIEITHRIFIDDLEKALEKKYKKKVYLTSTKELPEAETLIKTYLKENIKISINKKPQEIVYLAREVEGDVLIFYTKKHINLFSKHLKSRLLMWIYYFSHNKKAFLFIWKTLLL